jgi:membrane fusion protein (multidrug efflux system)
VVEREKTERAIVIPRSAMQFDQAGRYVLVVSGDNEVERRRIEIGQEIGPEVVVADGLKEGDRIITEGIQRVRPGIKVQPTEAEPPSVEQGGKAQ